MKYRSGFPPARGFTLIELIVTLVIVSVAAVALFTMFADVLPRSPTPAQVTQAEQLAQERMELILGQELLLGFGSTALDPCPGPAICTVTSGFTVTSSGANALVAWPVDNDTGRYRLITVTVNGPAGTQLSQLAALVANYGP